MPVAADVYIRGGGVAGVERRDMPLLSRPRSQIFTSFAACALDLCLKRLTRLAGGNPPLPPPRSSSEDELPGDLCRAIVFLKFFPLFGVRRERPKKRRLRVASRNSKTQKPRSTPLFSFLCFRSSPNSPPHESHAGSPGTRRPHRRRVSDTEGRWEP